MSFLTLKKIGFINFLATIFLFAAMIFQGKGDFRIAMVSLNVNTINFWNFFYISQFLSYILRFLENVNMGNKKTQHLLK